MTAERKGRRLRMRYVCSVCGYIYDETRESVPFADLPPSWKCPVCKAAKTAFAPEHRAEGRPRPPEPPAAAPAAARRDGERWELSPGVLAALCSNLARGCEKQYKAEEAALFRQLAEACTAAAPPEPEADLSRLAELIRDDLERGYPAARAAAPSGRRCGWYPGAWHWASAAAGGPGRRPSAPP